MRLHCISIFISCNFTYPERYIFITVTFNIAALVTTFNVEIGITGAILTKLDGDSRGGAALSVKEVCFVLLTKGCSDMIFHLK